MILPYLWHSKDYLDLYISHMARSMGKEVHSIEGHDERCAVKRRIDMKKAGEKLRLYLRLSRRSQWMPYAIGRCWWSTLTSNLMFQVHLNGPYSRTHVNRNTALLLTAKSIWSFQMALYFELRISDLLHNTTCIKGDVLGSIKLYREGALHGMYDDELTLTLARSKRSTAASSRADCPKRLQGPIKKLWFKDLFRQLDSSVLIRYCGVFEL